MKLKLLIAGLICWGSAVSGAESAIPFTSVRSMFGSGNVIVPCRVNNQDFLRCKVDTGAVFSSVNSDLLDQKGEKSHEVQMMSFAGKFVTCNVTLKNSVEVGPKRNENSLLLECPKLKVQNVDVILGLDVLAKNSFNLDYQAQTLDLSAPAHQSVTYSLEPVASGHIVLPLFAGRDRQIETKALFDTGAAVGLVDFRFVREHADRFTIIQDNSVTDTHGNEIVSQLVISGVIEVGSQKFSAEYFMAVDLSAASEATGEKIDFILGHNQLKTANWYFDLPGRTWSNF